MVVVLGESMEGSIPYRGMASIAILGSSSHRISFKDSIQMEEEPGMLSNMCISHKAAGSAEIIRQPEILENMSTL